MGSEMRVAFIALAVSVLASGQSLGIQPRQEPRPNPTSKPLPRRFVGVHPITILSGLLSSSPEQRKQALQQLGDLYTDATERIDASLRAVNLDADPELEYVLIAKGFPTGSTAYVFDRDEEGWWVTGEFSYWWHWDANEAERFLELREIVRYGRKDIIVRDTEGGTGLKVTELSIYRLNNGLLYRVFQTTEDREDWVVGTNRTDYVHRVIEFPDPDKDGNVFLVSRYQKRSEFSPRTRPDRKIGSCSAFRWDANAFVFVEDKTAAATLCRARP
jgi:hypothetical protein